MEMVTRQTCSKNDSKTSNKNAPALSEGEMAIERLLELAQYEVDQDPYRGMLSANSPWSQCQVVDQIDASASSATRKVSAACNCTCPSLVYWTEQHEAEQNKRRKRKRNKAPIEEEEVDILGHRPLEKDFQCACDFNPLCLASLGGVMDELLEKVAQKVQEDEDTATMESQSQADSSQEVIALDGAATLELPKPKRAKPSPIIEYSSSDDGSMVEPGKHRASGVFTVELATEHLELNPEKKNAIYSDITAEEMKKVRKTSEIDLKPVQVYVEGTILSHLGEHSTLSFQDYMEALRKWHDSLSFSNPLLTTKPAANDKLTIAMPPGIKNLGATCYLNTQFQCLARMTAFLNGLFSWTPTGENHGMNSVLSTMQLLFARMVHGSEALVTTQEFSDALGLENDEMQDPNEFARLLFERMHESFQQCSGEGVSQLLPKLFHGVTTYETSCSTCQNVTERSEGFMDLNLPIVDLSEGQKKQTASGGQTKITDTFADEATGTNVQYCLNEYISAESLDGDNQYFCECCQVKRDALRSVKFTQLPPVLNVQLSRYVFDRKRFIKKKLSDKVLLPKVLTVPMKGKNVDSRYLLCAVMKHRGTSAYQGHYIAEAMDWQSGTWFEFNDELVSVLDGPSNSYVPEELENLDSKKVKGSQDAYNMYYVEEGFLSECSSNFLTARAEMMQTDVIAKVRDERGSRYSMLTEMCFNDGKVASRLLRRRVGLMKKLSDALSSHTGDIIFNQIVLGGGSSQPVWVDGNILRRFFSTDMGTDSCSIVTTSGPLLKHKHLLCSHGTGLHPRIARRGKLLPRPLYDAIVSLMLGERRMLNEEHNAVDTRQIDENAVNDCIITPTQNMNCELCVHSYKAELREKIEKLRRLRQLYYNLEPSKSKQIVFEDDDETVSDAKDTSFLVSRTFITAFRKQVKNVITSAEASERELQGNKKAEHCCEGVDFINLSAFDPNNSSSTLDFFVNHAITCEHNNCNGVNGRNAIRVPGEVWSEISHFFPNAICHTVGKDTLNSEIRCEICEEKDVNNEVFASELYEWSKAVTSSALLKDVARKKRTGESFMEAFLLQDSDDLDVDSPDEGYLVHTMDVEAWRQAVKEVKKSKGNSSSTLTEKLVKVLGWSNLNHLTRDSLNKEESIELEKGGVMDTNVDVFGHMIHSMKPLTCANHALPLERVVFKVDADPKNSCVNLVSGIVEPLTFLEYDAFVRSVYDLGILLSKYFLTDADEECNLGNSAPQVTPKMMKRFRQMHQKVHRPLEHLVSNSSPLTSDEIDMDDVLKKHYVDGICRHEKCNKEFEEANDAYIAKEVAEQEAIDIDLCQEMIQDMDESGILLRIFQLDAKAESEAVVSSILGLPSSSATSAVDAAYGSLRRSTRKRKTTNEHVLREDSLSVQARYNIAAVRANLYEKYSAFPVDQDLVLIIPKPESQGASEAADSNCIDMTTLEEPASNAYIAVLLPFTLECNMKSLEEIIKENDVCSLTDIFLYWRASDGKKKAKSGDDTADSNEALFISLLPLENSSSGEAEEASTGEKKKKSRQAERGFRGTLLHSLSAPSSKAEEGKKSSDVEGSSDEKKADQNGEKRADQSDSATPPLEKENATNDLDESSKNDAVTEPAAVVILNESEDEETLNQIGSKEDDYVSVLVSHTNTACTRKQARQLRSSTHDPKEEAILKRLMSNVEYHSSMYLQIQAQCRRAVKWAISSNPEHISVDELADAALAKFYDGSQ